MIEIAAVTHRGLVREYNEDAFLLGGLVGQAVDAPRSGVVLARYALVAEVGLVLALADGVGGNPGGEIASRVAVEALARAWAGWPPAGSSQGPKEACAYWRQALEQAHRAVTAQGASRPEWLGMGSTVAGVHLHGRWGAVVFHAGDSRVWRFRQGILKALTTDHSYAELARGAELASRGAHYGEEAPRTNSALWKCVGTGAKELDPTVENPVTGLNPGDRYLLATDGLHDMVSPVAIEELLGAHPQTVEALEVLASAALAAGGADNLTAILADVREPGGPGHEADGDGEEARANG